MRTERVQEKTLHRNKFQLAEVKADDETGTISGYGAVFGNLDSHGDVIEKGAFKRTLREWEAKGKYPPMLLQHGAMGVTADDMIPIGRWTKMREDRRGLQVEGKLLAMNTDRGQYIYEGLKAGVLDGLSIGYMAREVRFGEKADEPERTLLDVDLWELSVVTFPSNSEARVSGVKSEIASIEGLRALEDMLRDAGKFSKSEAARILHVIKSWLRRDAGVESPQREAVGDPDEELAAALALKNALASYNLRQLLPESLRGQSK